MDKVLAFIKKYTMLLIPAGILVFALILLIPTLLIGGSIKEKMKKSVSQGKSVSRSLNSAHSKKDVENMTFYQNQLENDSKEVARLVRQATQRELISYDIFPEPVGSSNQIFDDYGTKYCRKIEELLKSANARSAPTTIEIEQELAKRGSVDRRQTGTAAYNKPRRRKKGRNADAYDLTRDAFLKKRAQEMAVYATANVFDWYTFWEETYKFENQETALEDCWYSQLSYWVYEDVVETIKSINSGSLTVFKSGVKRLVGVNFQKNADYLAESNRNSGMAGYDRRSNRNVRGDTPQYVMKADVPGVFGFGPWTGRVCDDKIDVIHFSMAVVIRVDSVFPFIKELCSEKEHTYKGYLKDQKPQTFKRNQITVMQYWQEPIDKYASEHLRYRYGDDAVVKLNLSCEYILTRSGYDEIKPDSIVKLLEAGKTGAKNNRYGR